MNKKDINELREEYEKVHMSDAQLEAFKKSIAGAKKDKQRMKKYRSFKIAGMAAAAAMLALIILPNSSAQIAHAMGKIPIVKSVIQVVTFRSYQYTDGNQEADISAPGLAIAKMMEEGADEYNDMAALPMLTSTLDNSVAEMNEDIGIRIDVIIKEFEENRKAGGYQEVVVSHEVIASSERYFVLKLICRGSMADTVEYQYFYTLDLLSGEHIELGDLFLEHTDYISIINQEIKRQMRQRMAADENTVFFLDDEIEECNFRSITDKTQFYVNEDNHLVISFQEGEVAPMYMGVISFEIPDEVIQEIRVF